MMLSNAALLFDAQALVIVVIGTLLATLARSGLRECAVASQAARELTTRGFEAGTNRAALARIARTFGDRGYGHADFRPPPDPPLAELIGEVLATGSSRELQSNARNQRELRDSRRREAQRVFEQASELAPVFGLVGTLFAITQLMPQSGLGTVEVTMASVATAALSSLYGVLLAHFVMLPLARAIERRGIREERERAAAIDWFESQLTGASLGRKPVLRDVA